MVHKLKYIWYICITFNLMILLTLTSDAISIKIYVASDCIITMPVLPIFLYGGQSLLFFLPCVGPTDWKFGFSCVQPRDLNWGSLVQHTPSWWSYSVWEGCLDSEWPRGYCASALIWPGTPHPTPVCLRTRSTCCLKSLGMLSQRCCPDCGRTPAHRLRRWAGVLPQLDLRSVFCRRPWELTAVFPGIIMLKEAVDRLACTAAHFDAVYKNASYFSQGSK